MCNYAIRAFCDLERAFRILKSHYLLSSSLLVQNNPRTVSAVAGLIGSLWTCLVNRRKEALTGISAPVWNVTSLGS